MSQAAAPIPVPTVAIPAIPVRQLVPWAVLGVVRGTMIGPVAGRSIGARGGQFAGTAA